MTSEHDDALYGSVELPLSLRQWLCAAALVTAVLAGLPVLQERAETLRTDPEYRIPYEKSNDYWLFERYSRLAASESKELVLGDSVVWGQYVAADETLSHYLAALAGEKEFVNLGVDGMYPVALAGLLEQYGGGISNCRVILHLNPLWLASREHDLRAGKEFRFNHPELLPQFSREISAYRASYADRLAIAAERFFPFRPWVRHWRLEHLGGADLARWTLAHPYANPISAAAGPSEAEDPARGSNLSWKERGATVQDFPWVALAESLQWRAFRDSVELLRRQGDKLLVLVGPFNEYMLTPRSDEGYRRVVSQVEDWLRENGVPYFTPPSLPSEDYADASHPLSEGYAMLAREVLASQALEAVASPTLPASARPAAHSERTSLIVFCSDRSGQWRLWTIQPDGTGMKQLTQGGPDEADVDPAFSPDGASILFTSTRGGSAGIWRLTMATGKLERICDGDQASWSPDGKSILFRRNERIFRRDLATGAEKALSPASWPHCSGPAWSPKGGEIAFACRWEAGNGVYMMPAEGGEPRKVYAAQGACQPHWSPDGSRLVYETETNLCTIAPDGTHNRAVTYYGGVQRLARYSPDGSRLVFCQAASPSGPWELYTVSAEGGEPTRLTQGGSDMYPDWR